MRLLVLAVFVIVIVAVNAKPSGLWWGGHGAVSPGAVVVGPAGSIHVGPSSGGAVIPGGHGLWGAGLWGGWGPWGHHGLLW